MASARLFIKALYRKVVPTRLRKSPKIAALKMQVLPHDMIHNMIYDSEYYSRDVEGPAVRSANTIANSIVSTFTPGRVVDIGCGTGALLQMLRERGCEVFGLEYSDAAIKCCRARQLNVVKFDLAKDLVEDVGGFDVAVSMEVAEHLPEKVANRYVDVMTSMAPQIVFTAAPPGQAGANHVNLQPPQYWILKFQQRGFNHADELSKLWHDKWKAAGDVESWYYQNLMIFRRNHI